MGSGTDDFIARITGNGNGGGVISTGWVTFQVNLGLVSAGSHTIVIGGYNNLKTFTNESTEVLIDDVVITAD